MTSARTNKIRELNDAFRTTLTGGRGYFTDEAVAMGPGFMAAALAAVRGFDAFTIENDPYGEHDFGCFTLGEEKVFWKIDTTTRRSATARTTRPTRRRPRASSLSCWPMSIRAAAYGGRLNSLSSFARAVRAAARA